MNRSRRTPRRVAPDGPARALRAVVEGTAAATGEAFFPALVAHLVQALGVRYAFVGLVDDPPAFTRARTLAVHFRGAPAENFTYPLAGSPCEQVTRRGEVVHVEADAARRFPRDSALARLGVEAYLGSPLHGSDGARLGLLVVMNDGPIDLALEPVAILQIFAGRAAAEVERLHREAQRCALEEELVCAQRLEGLGRLAGGVAHDFNDLLAVVQTRVSLALAELPAESPVRELLAPIREAAQRGAALTRQLLTFARRQVAEPRSVDLNGAIASVERLLGPLLGARIAVELRPAAGLWPAWVDPGQLEQVLVSLAVNARDAMPRGGRVTFSTANAPLGAEQARARGLAPGDYVRVSVQDNGPGMDAATLRRVFEPFFTTRGARGGGLGLATSLGVVQQAGGQLWAEGASPRGAAFHLLLPRAATGPPLTSPASSPGS